MSWYLESGKESDVVLSTRIRLARNIAEVMFPTKYTRQDAQIITNKVKDAIENIGYGLKVIKLTELDDITKLSLIEKHLVSPEFILNKGEIGAIAINNEENICIMINEEDHLRIQLLAAGLELENSLNLITEIDEKLSTILNYAYSNELGFLTSCPTNVGTGLRASVMVHLPALSRTGNINKMLEAINSFDMNIRGLYGENSNSQGNIYQISNKKTLGITEEETINNLKRIIEKVVEQERIARKILTKNPVELEDKIYRSYGILTNCKKISSEECKKLLSDIRMGTDLGIVTALDNKKVNKIDVYTKPGTMQKYLGEKIDSYERDIRRAILIKQIIDE